ncbi:MAG: hypothetical protein ABSB59_38800 [Streptosporangiaceae bacterium]
MGAGSVTRRRKQCPPGGPREPGHPAARRRWPPAAVRTARFWLAVAPASPLVFGSVALAIVVLPEEVTTAGSLSAGFAGLMTALSFAAGVAVQPVVRGPGRAGRGHRLLLRPGLPGLRGAVPRRRARRGGRESRRVHRADRDHRRARAVDGRIRRPFAPASAEGGS